MRVKAKSRVIIAWLLFMTLMPFFVVKAIHHHEECEISVCHSESGHSQNPCDQCPVCNFTLSPFIQAESFHAQVIIPIFKFEPVWYVNMLSFQPVYSHKLRAPPFLPALSY